MKEKGLPIPEEIKRALQILQQNDFEAYIVGGCVRDLLRNITPKDWDLTTNATPEQIQAAFDLAGFKTFYENAFGTVTVLTNSQKETLKNIEITPFRAEAKYSDKRHPDSVKFVKSLKQDLGRRDFTVNALALTEEKGKMKITDLFSGQDDLKNKIIRAVGKPEERFQEDALRMLRAVRFAVCLSEKDIWQIQVMA